MTHQNPGRPDWRVFTAAKPHGTYDRYDTEGGEPERPDSTELHYLAEEMKDR